MGRIFAIALIVLAIWTGVEVYTKGVGGAFGGLLSSFDPPRDRSAPNRAADAFQRAYNTSEKRVDRMLEEKGLE
jgi:hypothetical protein